MKLNKLKIAILFSLALPAASGSLFAKLTPDEEKKLENYIKEISTANPEAAAEFLEDLVFVDKMKIEKPLLAPALISKAEALRDLEATLDKRWYQRQENALSKALEIKVDFNKPLCSVGVGPRPQALLDWVNRFKKSDYSKNKRELIEKATRKYETVFGTTSVNGKAQWEKLTIRERNVFLAEKANKVLERLINTSSQTGPDFQNQVQNARILKYLDEAGRARFQRYIDQLRTAEIAKSSLKADQLAGLSGLPIEQQIYMLGRMFDKSEIKGEKLEREVDSLRQSEPAETINYQQRELLAAMLKTSLLSEMKGTSTGGKIAKFYRTHPLNVSVETCRNCYAKFVPPENKIVFDSDLVQQYMRVNGLVTSDLLKNKEEISRLAKFLSPMFAHEATHQMQHAWADSRNIYKPYTQEDEIEANSMEAVFTLEKMENDSKFKKLMKEMRGNISYADKRLQLAERFSKNPEKFDENVRQLYYYGLPSFSQVRAEILQAVSAEIQRRNSLSEDEKREIEEGGAGMSEVMSMMAGELISRVGSVKTTALLKVQSDLLNTVSYSTRYAQAQDWTETVFSMIGRGETKNKKPSSLASSVPEP